MVEKYLIYSRIFFSALWAMLLFPFVSQEIIPPLAKLAVPFNLLMEAIFLVMGVLTLRTRRDFFIAVSLLVIGFISSIFLNHQSMLLSVNGYRTYLGLIFTIPVLRWFMTGKNSARFMKSFDRLLFVFLVIQVPCVFWQFVKYGAGDNVGGSLGNWSSGIISSLIYTISFYLVSKRWDYDNYRESLKKNYIYFLLLLPTFFNETKASFIYIVLYFLLLLPLKARMVKQLVWILPVMTVLVSGLGVLYLKVTNQEADTVLSYDFFKEYFFGESTDHIIELAIAVEDEDIVADTWNGIVDMPRFSKLIVVPQIFRESHKSIWWGAGLGQFKGVTVVGLTPFAKRNFWLLRGSKPFSFYVFVELGIIGIIWSLIALISMFVPTSRITNGMNIKCYISFIFVFLYLYNDSLASLYFCILMFYMVMRTYYVPDTEPHLKDLPS